MSERATDADTDGQTGSGGDPTGDGDARAAAPDELRAEMRVLREENRRLREAYAHSRRTSYRRTALGLLLVGGVAGGGASLFPAVRQVLLALAAVGVFGAVLTYFLTPERFVAASVSERVYAAQSQTVADAVDELGLSDARTYVPTDGPTPARLFVPGNEDDPLPDAEALEDVFVVADGTRGLSLRPTGGGLFREFRRALAEPFGETPEAAVQQLTDALVEDFEMASGTAVDTDLDGAPRRATVRVFDGAYGRGEGFDDPAASLLAVGLARAVEAPVSVDTATDDDALIVTCRWRAEGDGRPTAAAGGVGGSTVGEAGRDGSEAAVEARE